MQTLPKLDLDKEHAEKLEQTLLSNNPLAYRIREILAIKDFMSESELTTELTKIAVALG